MLDGILLPHQPEFFPVAGFQQSDKLLFGEITVILAGHGGRNITRSPSGGRGVKKLPKVSRNGL